VRRFVRVASPPSGDKAARKVRRIDARDRPVADAQRPSADIHGAGAALLAAPCAPAPFRCVPSRRQPPEMIGDVGGSDRRRLLRDGDRPSSCNDAAHAPARRTAIIPMGGVGSPPQRAPWGGAGGSGAPDRHHPDGGGVGSPRSAPPGAAQAVQGGGAPTGAAKRITPAAPQCGPRSAAHRHVFPPEG